MVGFWWWCLGFVCFVLVYVPGPASSGLGVMPGLAPCLLLVGVGGGFAPDMDCRPVPSGVGSAFVFHGEFDPGSGRTLAACLTHASRTMRAQLAGSD